MHLAELRLLVICVECMELQTRTIAPRWRSYLGSSSVWRCVARRRPPSYDSTSSFRPPTSATPPPRLPSVDAPPPIGSRRSSSSAAHVSGPDRMSILAVMRIESSQGIRGTSASMDGSIIERPSSTTRGRLFGHVSRCRPSPDPASRHRGCFPGRLQRARPEACK